MAEDRRTFLKVAGLGALGGLAGSKVAKAVTDDFVAQPGAKSAKRWAMVIDLNKIQREDVRTAVSRACHTAHNVPDIGLPEEEVKWIWTESYKATFPLQVDKYTPAKTLEQSTLVLCNHCDRAPCVRVCPTKSTWKRESDGIIMMDMHRCIGCRYCMAACPYGSRSFNWRDPKPFIKTGLQPDFPNRSKGVVEKCNFCAERLARGKNPICVEVANRVGGPGTILFGDLADPNSEVARAVQANHTIRRKPSLGTSPQVFYVV